MSNESFENPWVVRREEKPSMEVQVEELRQQLEAKVQELEKKLQKYPVNPDDPKLSERIGTALQNAGFGATELGVLAVFLGQKVSGSDFGLGELPLISLVGILLLENGARAVSATKQVLQKIKMERESRLNPST